MSFLRSSKKPSILCVGCGRSFHESGSHLAQRWRPTSLKRLFLAGTLFGALVLLGCTAFLHYKDFRDGAVLFADRSNGFSKGQVFLIRYLPTIVVVGYGMLISVMDLDIKRLEPWYKLSETGKAASQISPLLYRYDTDFVLTVVFKALRHRHWTVLSSSCLLVFATLVIPAIQNAMFTTRTRTQARLLSVDGPQQLLPLETQLTTMSSSFLNSAYSRCWLGQSMPAFTTEDYVLSPFAQDAFDASAPDTTVTSQTTRFWTELRCWAPSSIELDYKNNITTFSDGRGCTAKGMLSFSPSHFQIMNGTYEAMYFGGQNPYQGNNSWPGYCIQFPHLLLVTWRYVQPSGTPPDYATGGDATAMFCEPEYFMEEVEATIVASNGTLISYAAIGPLQRLSDDVFNRTNFESIITNGRSPLLGDDGNDNSSALDVDIADGATIDQGARLFNAGVSSTQGFSASSAMVGFALGVSQLPASDLINFNVLQQSFAKAHRLLFALAMTSNFDQTTSRLQDAKKISLSDSVHLIPGFAIATESTLVVVAALCALLLWTLPRRTLKLCKNPESLAAIMSLCRSSEVQKIFGRSSGASESAIKAALHGKELLLVSDRECGLVVRQGGATTNDVLGKQGEQHSLVSETPRKPKHLPEISWSASVSTMILLAGSIIMFLALNSMSREQRGIRSPTSSEFMQQLLLSFIPTAFATLLGAYLVLVTRSHSFLQPFEDLYNGNAPAASTLLVTYTSLPAPLLFVRALVARHYLLALLSTSALLSNVLTITMASMFLGEEALASTKLELPGMYQPNVINVDILGYRQQTKHNLDAIYATAANLSSFTRLPPWTTTDYGYLPINISSAVAGFFTEYEFENTGYGAELDCIDLLSPSSGINASLDFGYQGTRFRLLANYSRPEGGQTTCRFEHHLMDEEGFGVINGQLTTAPSALEISNTMAPINASNVVDRRFCGNFTVKAWVRGRLLEPAVGQNTTGTSNFEYNATAVSCTSRMKMQQARLRVTADGNILSAIPLGRAEYDLPPTANLTSTFNTAVRATSDYYSTTIWHKDLVARDWSNYLYKKLLNSTDLVDASHSVPSFAEVSKPVGDTFKRLFALQVAFDQSQMLPLDVSVKDVSTWDTSAFPDQAPGPYTVAAKAYYSERRIFISHPSFVISIAILAFNFVVLLLFRLRLRKPFLPRMPFTIASQIAFFSGSHVIDDVVKAGGHLEELGKRGYTYGYGRYIGKDGWAYVGIERDPFVTRLHEGKVLNNRANNGFWSRLWPWSTTNRTPRSVKIGGFEFQPLPDHDKGKYELKVVEQETRGNWI